MKRQKSFPVVCGVIFLTILLLAPRVTAQTENNKKQWVVFHNEIPEGSTRYHIDLKYMPSTSYLCRDSRGDSQSVSLPEGEEIDGYKERIDFGAALDGYRYSALLRDARELNLISRDRRQIHKVRILRSKQDSEPEIVKEGYFFLGNQIEIPFQIPGQQLSLPTNETLPGTFSMNIYWNQPYSYRGSFTTRIMGTLKGSVLIESANLEVSMSYSGSLSPDDMHMQLALRPFDKELPPANASGKTTDILKLRSANLVVEKIAQDHSRVVLAVIKGDINKALKGKTLLRVNKPVPAFVRVDLIRRQLLTLEQLRNKKGSNRYVVLIFGDLKRGEHRNEYELMLDETVITKMLRRDLDSPPVVVFVSRSFFFTDLYERWLGRNPGFYLVGDNSNPTDIQFVISQRYGRSERGSSQNSQTLREQFGLPQNKVSVLVVNGEGNLAYIDANAAKHLAETLVQINKLMKDKKSANK